MSSDAQAHAELSRRPPQRRQALRWASGSSRGTARDESRRAKSPTSARARCRGLRARATGPRPSWARTRSVGSCAKTWRTETYARVGSRQARGCRQSSGRGRTASAKRPLRPFYPFHRIGEAPRRRAGEARSPAAVCFPGCPRSRTHSGSRLRVDRENLLKTRMLASGIRAEWSAFAALHSAGWMCWVDEHRDAMRRSVLRKECE